MTKHMLSHKNHETPHKHHTTTTQIKPASGPFSANHDLEIGIFHSEAKIIASRWPVGPSLLTSFGPRNPPRAVFLRWCLVVRSQISSEGRSGLTSEPEQLGIITASIGGKKVNSSRCRNAVAKVKVKRARKGEQRR